MNAIASKPAVRSAIGVPSIAFGTLFMDNCSRIPANSTNASAKPMAVQTAYHKPVHRLGSAPPGSLFANISGVATMIATPRIQQLVVISGRNTPSAC